MHPVGLGDFPCAGDLDKGHHVEHLPSSLSPKSPAKNKLLVSRLLDNSDGVWRDHWRGLDTHRLSRKD